MNEALPWLILAAAVVNLVLIVIVLVRGSKASETAGREVRDELRASREEARNAGKELREEVSGGLKSTNEVLSKTLEGMGKLQHAQLEGMTKHLGELTESKSARPGSHPWHL